MTKTIQPNSWVTRLIGPDKDYHTQKSEPEDNLSIYLSLLDDLNVLYKNLYKINYLAIKNNSLNVMLPYFQELRELTRFAQDVEIQYKEKGEKE